ncbi:MAG: acetyl-CoA carboxylase biotin carboxyl carrier protein subunit [Clostridiales bacterium]|jgi:acetyl-CoA carboxylase biotin carboxyl carrier protein|nr:acetyl-CoA carboxylase biotin carboxyl carrier protein subunit [Clostridiales bacterium]
MSITDIGYISGVTRVLRENNLTRLEISEGNAKILLERAGDGLAVSGAVPAAVSRESAPQTEDFIDLNDVTEVKAPLVGVFYSAPSPDAEPFVRIGDEVKKGDVLCIIEAMKLLNEITAETDGKVADICVKNGDIAEYGQVLFKLSGGVS